MNPTIIDIFLHCAARTRPSTILTTVLTKTLATATLFLSVVTLPAIALEPDNDSQWVRCASEWGTCKPPVPAEVRYGAELDGQAYYVLQHTDGAIKCSNNTFGNPLNIIAKHCDYQLSNTTDYDGDNVADSLDAFPSDPTESADADADGFGDNSDPFPNDSSNNADGNWVYCTSEWRTCSLPATALVRYGANGVYAFKTATDSIRCSNSVFGNPINIVKSCDYLLSTTNDSDGDSVADHLDAFPHDATESNDTDGDGFGDNSDPFPNDSSNNADGNWVYCTSEWRTCSLPATALVRYGANGVYAFKTATDSIRCSNSVFGNPISVVKSCDYLLSTTDDFDGDGIADNRDIFPNDPTESADSDGDGMGDNRDPFPNDARNNSSGIWVSCANEWETCQPPIPSPVRYGATKDQQDYYTYQSVDDAIRCVDSVFGSPINGVKHCDYSLSNTADYDNDGVVDSLDVFPNDSTEAYDRDGDKLGDNSDPYPNDATNNSSGTWTFCANEWEACNVPNLAIVRYGAESNGQAYFVYQYANETIACRNSVFGDPISNVLKRCEFLLVDTTPVEIDSDGDGIADTNDAYPNDPLQSQDSNGDGIGDNTVQQQLINYTYNDQGQILTIDGPRTDVNDITTYTYDDNGYRTHITNALGHQILLAEHNGRGQPQRITDVNGTETVLAYHVRGWLLSATVQHDSGDSGDSGDSTTLYAYDNVGNVTSITLPEGETIGYTYDSSNRLVAMSNGLGERIDYTLDKAGNRLSQTISLGGETTYRMTQAYDELSRLMTTIGAEQQTTNIDYDVNGNPTNTTNPREYSTQNQYDPLNRLSQINHADTGTTIFTYDDQDRLTSVTDANGNITRYTYNAFGHLTQLDSPDTGIARYAYDNAGNRVISVDSRGIVTRYTYDVLNRLTHTQYPTSPEEDVTYTYDVNQYTHNNGETYQAQAIGKLFSIKDQSGVQFYGYDHLGNVIVHVRAIGHNATDASKPTYSTDYVYDRSNKLIEVQSFIGGIAGVSDPLRYYVTYRHDSAGRVNEIIYGTENGPAPSDSLIDSITYLPLGPASQIEYANGVTTQYSYDQDYRLSSQQTHTDSDTLLDRSYQYDANGNITQIDHLDQPSNTQDFGYDPLDRLLNSDTPTTTTAYSYDLVGNRLSINTDNYGYDLNSNTLLDIHKPITTRLYTVDTRGNTTQMTEGSNTTTFTYNAANRPSSVVNNGVETQYTYNALGQRASKTNSGVTTHYAYNLQGQLVGEYQADGQAIVEYIYWNNQPLAQIRNQAVYYYHNDHLGTPAALTNAAQETVWQASYTAFGEAGIVTEQIDQNLRFAGQYFDEETGLHYNYFRYYDPETGRYTQSDPIGLDGGINTYLYALANPLKYIDPFGLAVKCKTILKLPYRDIQVCFDDGKPDTKKRNKQKREKKQLDDICKEYGIDDRDDFGDFLEDWKPDNGYSGGDTLSYDVLRDVARQYRGY